MSEPNDKYSRELFEIADQYPETAHVAHRLRAIAAALSTPSAAREQQPIDDVSAAARVMAASHLEGGDSTRDGYIPPCGRSMTESCPEDKPCCLEDALPSSEPRSIPPVAPVAEEVTKAPVSYTHLRAHETPEHLVCRLLLEKKK